MSDRTADDEAAIDATKAPLLDHLIELRKRLIYSIIAFVIGFAICFAFAEQIYGFLTHPLALALKGQKNDHLIYTQLYETFFTYVKVGMFGGLCLSFPYIAGQLWLFVAPGLYRDERKAIFPFLFASPVLFLIGASFVYFIMLPVAIQFFASFQTSGKGPGIGIELLAKVSDYLDFVMTLIVAFGLTFQMPVLLALLGRVGIISAAQLRSFRRYAVVAIFAVAAVVTPPDVFSQLSLALPLLVLYEISILCVWLIEKKRAEAEAAKDEETPPSA